MLILSGRRTEVEGIPARNSLPRYSVYLFLAFYPGDEPLDSAETADAVADAMADAFANRFPMRQSRMDLQLLRRDSAGMSSQNTYQVSKKL